MMQKIIMAIIFGLIVCLYAQNMGKKPDEGYRIEVVVDTIQKTPLVKTKQSLVFLSPESKVIRKISLDYSLDRLEYRRAIISTNGKYVLYTEILPKKELREHPKDEYIMWTGEGLSGWAPYRLTFFNKEGKILWRKIYEVQFVEYAYDVDEAISGNGERVLFYYSEEERDSSFMVKGHVIVLDTLGKEIVHIVHEGGLSFLQISPDGKIVGAETHKELDGKYLKHLFFLDVETGRTKIVKAEGEIDGKRWRASFSLRKDKKIYLYGGWHHKKAQSAMTAYDELPDDLSTLFGGGQ